MSQLFASVFKIGSSPVSNFSNLTKNVRNSVWAFHYKTTCKDLIGYSNKKSGSKHQWNINSKSFSQTHIAIVSSNVK